METNYFASPLLCAAYKNNEKLVEMLLKKGAIVNTKLQSIIAFKKALGENGKITEKENENEYRLKYGSFSLYVLNQEDKHWREFGYSPLHYAIRNNQSKIAKLLLDQGANVDARSENDLSPLCLACGKDESSLIQLLLKSGVDLNSEVNNGKHILRYALKCVFDNTLGEPYDGYNKTEWILQNETFAYLLKIGADPNGWSSVKKENVLHYAANNGMANAVHLLLKYGANVNSVDGELKTPLDYSVSHLQDLLQNIQDNYCYAPDSSSDDDYYENRHYSDSSEEEAREVELEERRKAREEERKRQYEKRKIYNLTHNTYTYDVWQYRKNINNDEGFSVYQDPDPFRLISQLLTRELVRLEMLGKRNVKQNVKLLESVFVKPYYTRCKNEMKKMKKTTIADGVNYYDFLLASDEKLTELMKNPKISSVIDREYCRKTFPNYCRFLRLNVKRGTKRKRSDDDDDDDDDVSNGSSDEEVGKGSVQVRGKPKRRHWMRNDDCVIS